jgi:ribosomal protein S19E (S16A)
MDQNTYNNWVKIKEAFEKSGNTNNMFYTRACAIVRTKVDPMEAFWGKNNG